MVYFMRVWVAVLGFALALATAQAWGGETVGTRFEGATFDRWLFRTEGTTAGRWEVLDGSLQGIIRPRVEECPKLKFVGEFHLEGDFEVTTAYALRSLPHPKKGPGSNNVEIFVSGPDGFATLFRNNEAGAASDGVGFYHHTIDDQNHFQHQPTAATGGLLRLRRDGRTLRFFAGKDEPLDEIGSVVFGTGVIDSVLIQEIANNTGDGIDARFDRFDVSADKIVRLLERPRSGPSRGLTLGGIGLALVALLAVGAIMARRRQTKPTPARRGVTLIELLMIIAVLGVLMGLLLPAVQAAREAARRSQCTGNLKWIAVAMHNYESTYGSFPPGVTGVTVGPRWSPQVMIFPFSVEQNLYNAINFNGVPWGHHATLSAMNSSALRTKISWCLCPSDLDQIDDPYDLGHNNYRATAGTLPHNLDVDSPDGTGKNNGVFYFGAAVKIADVTDGTSNTVFFSERCRGRSDGFDPLSDIYAEAPPTSRCSGAGPATSRRYIDPDRVEWSGARWADGNSFYTRYQQIIPPNGPSCNFGSKDYDGNVVMTPTSRHPGGINVAFADASIRFIRNGIQPQTWQKLGTIAGGEGGPADQL